MGFDLAKMAEDAKQNSELENIVKDEFTYIPPIRLCQHQSGDVKTENKRARQAKEAPKFGAGSFCVEEEYYDNIKIIPMAWRPCATEFDGDNFVRAVFDSSDPEYMEIAKKAKDRVEGFRSGVEFLFYSSQFKTFLTMFYYGSFIRKNGVKKVNALMGQPTTLFSEEVSSNGYDWHVPKVAPGDYLFTEEDHPSDEFHAKAMELFNDRSKKTPSKKDEVKGGEEVTEEVGSKKKRKR